MPELLAGFPGAVPAAPNPYALLAITPHLQVVVQHGGPTGRQVDLLFLERAVSCWDCAIYLTFKWLQSFFRGGTGGLVSKAVPSAAALSLAWGRGT